MITEDLDVISLGLKLSLDQYDDLHHVGIAKDGLRAVEMALRCKPDLILMDTGMPHLDGTQATRRICQVEPDIKIVMYNSKDRLKDICSAFAAGATGYCLKEVSIEGLHAAMHCAMLDQLAMGSVLAANILEDWKNLQAGKTSNLIDAEKNTLSHLSIQILNRIAVGETDDEIAKRLGLTVEKLTEEKRTLRNELAACG